MARNDTYSTCLDAPRDSVRPGEVTGENGAPEPVGGVVGAGDDVGFIGEFGHRDEGPEDLFARDGHGIGDVGENGGVDEEPFVPGEVFVGDATGEEGGAFGFPGVDVGEHALVLGFRDLWALVSLGGEGVADFADFGDGVLKGGDEGVVDTFVDENARGGGADLAHAGEERMRIFIFEGHNVFKFRLFSFPDLITRGNLTDKGKILTST